MTTEAHYEDQMVNDLNDLEGLIARTGDFLKSKGASQYIFHGVELVLEELITNTIKYGYDGNRKHRIQIALKLCEAYVDLFIRDRARVFDPTQRPKPNLEVPIEDREIGGLGLHLVKQYVECFEYKREGEYNVLWVRIKNDLPESVDAES